jgi:hypothetical protein
LRDRQKCRCGKSKHRDKNIDDRSEPRVINEEMREFHDPAQPWF